MVILPLKRMPPLGKNGTQTHLQKPRLVARAQGNILGFISLAPVSGRAVYSGVAEVSLYVSSQYRKLGIGSALMSSSSQASEKSRHLDAAGQYFPGKCPPILPWFKKHGSEKSVAGKKIARMTYGDFKGTWRDTVSVEGGAVKSLAWTDDSLYFTNRLTSLRLRMRGQSVDFFVIMRRGPQQVSE